MCLGIPGRIVEVWREDGAPMARVDFAGELRRICLAYLPDLGPGDYLIAHMGFALTRVDEETARSTLRLMHEYGVLPAASVGADTGSAAGVDAGSGVRVDAGSAVRADAGSGVRVDAGSAVGAGAEPVLAAGGPKQTASGHGVPESAR